MKSKFSLKAILSCILVFCLVFSLALTANATNFVKDFNEDGSIPETVTATGKKMLKIEAVDVNADGSMETTKNGNNTVASRIGWWFNNTKAGEVYTVCFKYKSPVTNLADNSSGIYLDVQRQGGYYRFDCLTNKTCTINEEGIYEYSANFTRASGDNDDHGFFVGITFTTAGTVYISDFSITDSKGTSVINNTDFYENLNGVTNRYSIYPGASDTGSAEETTKTFRWTDGGDTVTATLMDYDASVLTTKQMLHFKTGTDASTSKAYTIKNSNIALSSGQTYTAYFKIKVVKGHITNNGENGTFQIRANYNSYQQLVIPTTVNCTNIEENADGYSSFKATFTVGDKNINNLLIRATAETEAYIADFSIMQGDTVVNEDITAGFTTLENFTTDTAYLETYDKSIFVPQPTKMMKISKTEGKNTRLGYQLNITEGTTYNISFLYRVCDADNTNDDMSIRASINQTFGIYRNNRYAEQLSSNGVASEYTEEETVPTCFDVITNDYANGWSKVSYTFTATSVNTDAYYYVAFEVGGVGDLYIGDFKVVNTADPNTNLLPKASLDYCGLIGLLQLDNSTAKKVYTSTTESVYEANNISDRLATVYLLDFDDELFRTKLDTVYVSNNGKDSNGGTESAPLASVEKAVKIVSEDGKIVLQDNYVYTTNNYSGTPVLTGSNIISPARHFNLRGNLALENTALNISGNIKTNRKNITIGEGVTFTNGAPIIETVGGETVAFAAKKYESSLVCGENTVVNAQGWIMLQNSAKEPVFGNGSVTIAESGTYKFTNSPDVNTDENLDNFDVTEVRTALLNDTTADKYDMNDDASVDICDLVRLYNVASAIAQ